MKTVVLIASLLIIGEVYAVSHEKVQSFSEYLTECEEELGKSLIAPKELRPDVIHCALKKHGTIGKQDDDIKNIAHCNDLVLNRASVVQCRRIFSDCIKLGYQSPGNNFEKGLKVIMCAVIKGVMSLIL